MRAPQEPMTGRHHPQAARSDVGDPARVPSPMDAATADLRRRAVERLWSMNVKHAALAWRQRRRDPLAAYGLAFLFCGPDPSRQDRWALAAATRLWLAGPEADDLSRLLFSLDQYAQGLRRRGPFDIRGVLANRADRMPACAEFCGIGLSSLDTESGTWEQAKQKAFDDTDLPGRVLIVLTDETLIIGERRGHSEFNRFTLTSNRSLEIVPGDSLYPCSWASTEDLRSDPEHQHALGFLENLSSTLCRADIERQAADRRNSTENPPQQGRPSHGR